MRFVLVTLGAVLIAGGHLRAFASAPPRLEAPFRPRSVAQPTPALRIDGVHYRGPRDTLGHWTGTFGLPYFDGSPSAMVVYQGQPVVAGYFQQVDGREVSAVLRWNGAAWEDLGTIWGDVAGLIVHRDDLIAVGQITGHSEGALGVAGRWNGARWEAFGPDSVWGFARAVASHDSLLLIGGDLRGVAGADTIRNVVLWDGRAWSAVAGGVAPEVYAVEFHEAVPHAAGPLRQSDARTVGTVERWDGQTWRIVGDTLTSEFGYAHPYTMATYAGVLHVGGYFSRAGVEEVPSLARWRDGRWEWPHERPDPPVVDLEVLGDTLYIASSAGPSPAGLQAFDGATLSIPSGWDGQGPTALASSDDALFVAARSLQGSSVVVRRDASGWRELHAWNSARDHGLASPPAAVAVFEGQLVVAGWNLAAGSGDSLETFGGVAAWDGVRWRALGNTRDWTVQALSVHRGTLVAGGSFLDPEQPALRNLAAWNGERWLPIGGGTDLGVSALETDGDRLLVGGWFSTVGDRPARHVAAWDGHEWTPMSLDAYGPVSLRALVAHAGRVHVGGEFETRDGNRHLAWWNGDRWQPVGAGVPSPVYALASFRGELYAGGPAGSSVRPLVAWNGSAWRELDLQGYQVSALDVWGGELVAGGSLFRAGGWTQGLNVFAFDGSDWRTFRRGIEGHVTTLAPEGDRLWVGGDFTRADGVSSFHLAEWLQTSPLPGPRPPRVALRLAGPNPFATTIGFDFGLPIRGRVRLKVYDVMGRERAVLEDGVREAGTHRVTWNGRDRDGRRVPAGVYLARLEAERTTVTRRFVHVP